MKEVRQLAETQEMMQDASSAPRLYSYTVEVHGAKRQIKIIQTA